MAKIILEGHCYNNISIPKNDIYSLGKKDKYHARILIDIISEICCTQIQFISYESKSTYWTKEEILVSFNEVYKQIELFVKNDRPIKVFAENIYYSDIKEVKINELVDDFQIEIPENKETAKNISTDLLQVKEAKDNFDKCKNKLFDVIARGPSLLNQYYYNIIRIIDYISDVTNASVITGPNNENLRHIRDAFEEMRKRKNIQHYNYQANLYIAQREIYTLDFPKFFKAELPKIEINQILEEIR